MTGERIGILGCGWLGLPLGAFLSEQGFPVKGSTTRTERFGALKDAGIVPFRISLEPELSGDDVSGFLQSDILVIDIPPERREDIVDYHRTQFASLLRAIHRSPVKKVLLVSSTSVYPPLNRPVKEEDAVEPESMPGRALLSVESMLRSEKTVAATVLRFCGLIGYDRDPSRFLARMPSIADAAQPVNLIHRDDCVRVIAEVIRQQAWGEVFNACSPGRPSRGEYYARAAERSGLGLPPTAAKSGGTPFKIIDSSKLERVLGYRFKVPDPLRLPEASGTGSPPEKI